MLFFSLVYRNNMIVFEPARGDHFVLEPNTLGIHSQCLFFRDAKSNHFQRDDPVRFQIFRPINDAHSTSTNLVQKFKMPHSPQT